eukprot:TRINITY_DN6323_c0_g1_i4.p1 TRINITY_DN6323_c0_g1~~TRINITY_DN6323_c0_g1_i4.p1  ORF type:complete len:917 (+),score=221.96 TRINITY_DN6323_c0_g1_i4:51-2801(+)
MSRMQSLLYGDDSMDDDDLAGAAIEYDLPTSKKGAAGMVKGIPKGTQPPKRGGKSTNPTNTSKAKPNTAASIKPQQSTPLQKATYDTSSLFDDESSDLFVRKPSAKLNTSTAYKPGLTQSTIQNPLHLNTTNSLSSSLGRMPSQQSQQSTNFMKKSDPDSTSDLRKTIASTSANDNIRQVGGSQHNPLASKTSITSAKQPSTSSLKTGSYFQKPATTTDNGAARDSFPRSSLKKSPSVSFADSWDASVDDSQDLSSKTKPRVSFQSKKTNQFMPQKETMRRKTKDDSASFDDADDGEMIGSVDGFTYEPENKSEQKSDYLLKSKHGIIQSADSLDMEDEDDEPLAKPAPQNITNAYQAKPVAKSQSAGSQRTSEALEKARQLMSKTSITSKRPSINALSSSMKENTSNLPPSSTTMESQRSTFPPRSTDQPTRTTQEPVKQQTKELTSQSKAIESKTFQGNFGSTLLKSIDDLDSDISSIIEEPDMTKSMADFDIPPDSPLTRKPMTSTGAQISTKTLQQTELPKPLAGSSQNANKTLPTLQTALGSQAKKVPEPVESASAISESIDMDDSFRPDVYSNTFQSESFDDHPAPSNTIKQTPKPEASSKKPPQASNQTKSNKKSTLANSIAESIAESVAESVKESVADEISTDATESSIDSVSSSSSGSSGSSTTESIASDSSSSDESKSSEDKYEDTFEEASVSKVEASTTTPVKKDFAKIVREAFPLVASTVRDTIRYFPAKNPISRLSSNQKSSPTSSPIGSPTTKTQEAKFTFHHEHRSFSDAAIQAYVPLSLSEQEHAIDYGKLRKMVYEDIRVHENAPASIIPSAIRRFDQDPHGIAASQLASNNLFKNHLEYIRQSVQLSQQHYVRETSREPQYQYTTLEDTLEYIRSRRKATLTFEQAKELVKMDENCGF